MVTRLPGWEGALAAYLDAHSNSLFSWGELDCALFAAGGVLAMTGTDIAAPFRGRYRTAQGSARALRRFGAGALDATFDQLLGARPIGFARRGDLVMSAGAVGICIGAEGLFLRLPESGPGYERIGRAAWTHAWSVGE